MNLCGVIVLLNVVIISLSHPCLNPYPCVIKVQSVSHTHACATMHTHTCACMHARAHTHTHSLTQSLSSISTGNCFMTTHADTHTGRLGGGGWWENSNRITGELKLTSRLQVLFSYLHSLDHAYFMCLSGYLFGLSVK